MVMWSPIFPSEEVMNEMSIFSLLVLMYFYGSILYTASCRISQGSEMLLLLYGAGIVGGLVIPILGAIPDGAIILISGLSGSTREETQQSLAVGVGTLAGSTIMLITVPWAIGVFLGRRDIENGEAATLTSGTHRKSKYTRFTWTQTGVTAFEQIPAMAKTMLVTSLLYLIIQVPAFQYHLDLNASQEERGYAIFGFIATVLAFFGYSWYQLRSAKSQEVVAQKQRRAAREDWQRNLNRYFPAGKSLQLVFNKFDVNGDGNIDRRELAECLKTLGLEANRQEVNDILREMDIGDGSGQGAGDDQVSLYEFEFFFSRILEQQQEQRPLPAARIDMGRNAGEERQRLLSNASDNSWADDCEDAEEDYVHLSDSAIRMRALWELLVGGALVTIFSDPMVSTISAFAKQADIGAFYVSFVVTPLASNASEVIAALVFAAKKNKSGISLTFGSLYGAANMNNTFALSIFLGLVTFRRLQWTFSAEVIAILVVTVIVGVIGMRRTVRMWQAAVVASLYPLSIVLVWLLKNKACLDATANHACALQ